jgi:hypothetical protein
MQARERLSHLSAHLPQVPLLSFDEISRTGVTQVAVMGPDDHLHNQKEKQTMKNTMMVKNSLAHERPWSVPSLYRWGWGEQSALQSAVG